jgi:hypothetical protein
MIYSPIALFIYNRPQHTRLALEALRQCSEFYDSSLYVFCDGPRCSEDEINVQLARNVAKEIVGSNAEFLESKVNLGLANSIISGVTQLCAAYGCVIVIEDDLLVSPRFLNYMNIALERYKDEDRIMQISGYMFPISEFAGRHEAFFLPLTTSWGWATWRRAWELFDSQASGWESMKADRELRSSFSLGGAFDYYKMLRMQIDGQIDSWAIRWYWSVFKAKGLVLYPPQSQVQNIGFDGSGTHGWRTTSSMLGHTKLISSFDDLAMPSAIVVDQKDLICVKKMLNTLNNKRGAKLGKIASWLTKSMKHLKLR